MIRTDKDWVWVKCPDCGAELQFDAGSAEAVAHMVECMKERQLEAHPEVSDEQIELGCEHLSPLKSEEL